MIKMMMWTFILVAMMPFCVKGEDTVNASKDLKEIKAYCLDFNWAPERRGGFAKPGLWKDADPATHVAWYKAIGANVIQTFCVSVNGYAWYKNGVVPEQPGLKHDFLTEVVKLGHAEGMKVMGYFCISANLRWGEENPELSYGTPSTYHIPYTDEYLQYLSSAISDAVKTTGIDGFMIDWVWMPRRQSTKGKWLEAEKKLYQQLMGEPFPGEDKLTKAQDLAYSRKAIDRCWKTIHKAAKEANPNCIIWLTTNNSHHKHVVDSDMYREVDWLMGESGKLEEILKLKPMVGKHTRLITCMSDFGGSNAAKQVPEAIEAGVGLYGYAKPEGSSGTINLGKIFPRQLTELTGNSRRIAVLARAYRGKSIDTVWQDGEFVEPENPLPFRINFRSRRGFSDTCHTTFEGDKVIISVRTPYQSGRALLTRVGQKWPSTIVVRLQRQGARPAPKHFQVANGEIGVRIVQDGETKVTAGEMKGRLDLRKAWGAKGFFDEGEVETPVRIDAVQASTTDDVVEVVLPGIITESNPALICFEWFVEGSVR